MQGNGKMDFNERNPISDIMKGIGMIMVIIGHTTNVLNPIIYTIHMPLFFIVSGYYMKEGRSIKETVKKGIRNLLLPYFLTCLCIIVYKNLVSFIEKTNALEMSIVWIKASLFGLPGNYIAPNIHGIQMIGAIWFLEALFWARVELCLVFRICNKWLQAAIVVVLAAISLCIKDFYWIPANVGTGLVAAFFVYLGVLIKRYSILDLLMSRSFSIGIAFIVYVTCVCYYWATASTLSLASLYFPLHGLDLFGAISGTYIIFVISSLISKHLSLGRHLLTNIGGGYNGSAMCTLV